MSNALDSQGRVRTRHAWLRVPLGKLHNARSSPLHPHVKETVDKLARRSPHPSFVLRSCGSAVVGALAGALVEAALNRAAASAGIDHRAPRQLRDTLATQPSTAA